MIPIGPVAPVEPVGPVGNWKGSPGEKVGPIKSGFYVAEDKNSSNIIHLWKIRITNSKCNDRVKRNGQAVVFYKFNKIVILIK